VSTSLIKHAKLNLILTIIIKMNNLLATLYVTFLGGSLTGILFFLLLQIVKKIETDTSFEHLKQKILYNDADCFDYYFMGTICLLKKLSNQAVLYFSRSLKDCDKSDLANLTDLYNAIGFTYSQTNQFDMSIYYYEEAISISPKHIVALKNLAYSYEKKKLFHKAIEIYTKILKYDETNAIAVKKLQVLRKPYRDNRI
jgi:tetratricopeptide (TPR) repeat protein